jgi:hypothetical protein
LRLVDQRADIAPANFCGHNDKPLPVFPADLVRPFREIEAGELPQRDRYGRSARGCLRQGNGEPLQHLDIVAQCISEPHHDPEAAIALKNQAGRATADGNADRILYVGHAKTAARDFTLVYLDLQKRQSRDLFDLDAGCTFDPSEHGGDLVGRAHHRRELVAVNLDRQVLPYTGDKLVETHLDRLGETELVAWQF